MLKDPELSRYFMSHVNPDMHAYAALVARALADPERHPFWIYLDNEIVGIIQMWQVGLDPETEKRRGFPFYMVKKEFHRQGIATAALLRILHYAFFEMAKPLEEAHIEILTANLGSIELATKVGFSLTKVEMGGYTEGEAPDLKVFDVWRGKLRREGFQPTL
jgi:RimJ/RimL family protein N-acetyltransferase